MALGSIAPLTCTPLLRGLPATARTAIIRRGGFSSRKASSEGVIRGLNSANRRLSSSPTIFPLGVLRRRAEQLRTELRGVRGKSSLDRKELGVADGEESRSTNPQSGLIILYSKPGCCLCDGLKEKLEGSDISGIQLEVRDITTNSEWWNLYQYEIPVLARVRHDGIEEALPRLSPRLTAQQVQKKILALLTSAA